MSENHSKMVWAISLTNLPMLQSCVKTCACYSFVHATVLCMLQTIVHATVVFVHATVDLKLICACYRSRFVGLTGP